MPNAIATLSHRIAQFPSDRIQHFALLLYVIEASADIKRNVTSVCGPPAKMSCILFPSVLGKSKASLAVVLLAEISPLNILLVWCSSKVYRYCNLFCTRATTNCSLPAIIFQKTVFFAESQVKKQSLGDMKDWTSASAIE